MFLSDFDILAADSKTIIDAIADTSPHGFFVSKVTLADEGGVGVAELYTDANDDWKVRLLA